MRDERGNPITNITLPAQAPKSVADARAELEQLSARWAAASDARAEAEKAATGARGRDVEEDARRLRAGEPALLPDERSESATRDAVVEAFRQEEILGAAVDSASSALADSLDRERKKWLTRIDGEIETARADFLRALARLEDADRTLVEVLNVREWLARLDAAQRYDYGEGKRVTSTNLTRLRYAEPLRGQVAKLGALGQTEITVAEFVDGARKIIESPAPPPRRRRPRRESSFETGRR